MRGRHWPPIAGMLALALALPGLAFAPRLFFACWLTAWWFAVGLLLGLQANLCIHRLTGGRWGRLLRPLGRQAMRRLPLALLLVLPLAAGLSQLYPWAGQADWSRQLARPDFGRWWLQPGFFWLRMAAYAGLWWWLARPATLARKGRAAAALALYLLSGTLASVDLLMSLVPGWYSSAFGLVVLSGQALGGAALATCWAARRAPRTLARSKPGRPPLGRDLGNLLLMWLMTWAYLAFMEFLIIWSEDLPAEIAWYLPRSRGGWAGMALALAALQLAVPMLALLQRRLKDRPARLSVIAGLLLATQLLNTSWLVLPSVEPAAVYGWWMVPLMAVGMMLLLFGGCADSKPTTAAWEAARVRS